MDSQINFLDSQTLSSRPDVTPGKIIVSSKGLGWDGLYIEKGENEEFTPDNVTVSEHYFAMNIGAPHEWEWKDGDRFRKHCYQTGDLWINPAGVPFSHRISGYNQFLLLTINPEKLPELLPDQPLIERQSFRREHRAQDPHLKLLMQALLLEAETGGNNGRLYVDSLFTAIATHFVNHYSLEQTVDLAGLQSTERQRLRGVIDYIEAHLTADISLADLALEAGISKFHFTRLFKDVFGTTPYKYLVQRRIEKAVILLKKQRLDIAEVAYELGFTDQAHFTRTFKKYKGTTPRQFLKS